MHRTRPGETTHALGRALGGNEAADELGFSFFTGFAGVYDHVAEVLVVIIIAVIILIQLLIESTNFIFAEESVGDCVFILGVGEGLGEAEGLGAGTACVQLIFWWTLLISHKLTLT